jgi:PAS domain S-box-containing protein
MLFATIPIPVWVCDLDTLDFLEVNQAAVEHYGYSRDAFLRMKIADIRPPEELERLTADLHRVRQNKQFSWAGKHRTQDGRVIQVEISSHTPRYDGHEAALAVAQDVTARVRLEMDLRHAQKLEAVGGLAAGIAHELNTPIQFVGDNTHFLQGVFADLVKLLTKYHQLHQAVVNGEAARGLADNVAEAEKAADLDFLLEEIPKAIAQSMDGVTRVATIVRAMKEFAHSSGGEKVPTDLNKALQSTLTVARNEIKYVCGGGDRFPGATASAM